MINQKAKYKHVSDTLMFYLFVTPVFFCNKSDHFDQMQHQIYYWYPIGGQVSKRIMWRQLSCIVPHSSSDIVPQSLRQLGKWKPEQLTVEVRDEERWNNEKCFSCSKELSYNYLSLNILIVLFTQESDEALLCLLPHSSTMSVCLSDCLFCQVAKMARHSLHKFRHQKVAFRCS